MPVPKETAPCTESAPNLIMTTNDRAIARLTLQIERGKLTVRQLTSMAQQTKNVLDLRRGELRAARAMAVMKKAKKKR